MLRHLLILVATLASLSLYAQKGAVSGTILDTDGFPLIGANIVIEGTGTGATTDFDGKYQFQADPGTYTLIASYIGYADQRFETFEITANDTKVLDIIMSEGGGVNIDEIVVTGAGIENSEVAVMMIRRGSDKVQDVISSQELSRLGAGNAAAALSKVTGTTIVDGKYVYVRGLGDRYSATTINGLRLSSIDPYRNSANLSLIPADIIENIIASKTFTPDLPGDFTGGSVNVNLKSLPERFTYGISLSTAFNEQANLRDDFLSFNAGGRAGLGFNDGTLDRPALLDDPRYQDVMIADAARLAERDNDLAQLVDEVANSFPTNFSEPRPTDNGLDYSIGANIGTQLEFGNTRIGLFATGSYSRSFSQYQNGINASYELSPGEDVLFSLFDYADNRSVETPELNGMVGLSIKPGANHTISFYSIYSHQTDIEGRSLQGAFNEIGVGGENSFFRSRVNWFRERQLSSHVLSGEHRIGIGKEDPIRVDWSVNLVDSEQNEPDIQFLAYTFDNIFQINRSQINGPQRFYRDLTDDFLQSKVDFTIPILQNASRGSSIKLGGFYSTKERDFNELAYEYRQRRGTTLNDAMANPDVFFADDNLGLLGVNESNGRNIIGLFITDNSNLSNSYVGEYDINAAYAMATIQAGPRLKAIFGGRVETTNIFVQSDRDILQLENNPEAELDETTEIDETDFLPAFNLIYSVSPNSNLRAGFSRTIARPNMREVAAFGSFGFIGDPITFGNPDLRLTDISNFDLRYEIFPEDRGGEVFAVSAFYKEFTNPIVTTFRIGGGQQFTWTNSESADLYGVELEFRKKLDVISPALSNFSFSGNLAYIQSEQAIDSVEFRLISEVDPTRERVREFSGQSDFVLNANLNYANEKGWDVTVAYNYFSDRLASIGSIGAPDIFERGRATLDMSVSKQISNFKFTVRARNLVNPAFETYSTFNGQEYIFQTYERGRQFSLGISYQM